MEDDMEGDYYEGFVVDLQNLKYTLQENYHYVWGSLLLAILIYLVSLKIISWFPKKYIDYDKNTIEQFDEEVRVSRLLQQEKMNELAIEREKQVGKDHLERLTNSNSLNSNKTKSTKNNYNDGSFSNALNGGGGGGGYRPSYSMRAQGSCCGSKKR